MGSELRLVFRQSRFHGHSWHGHRHLSAILLDKVKWLIDITPPEHANISSSEIRALAV